MLRLGCWILTLWTALNLVASAKIVFDTLGGHGHTPALFLILTPEEVEALGPEVLATLDSIALFANGLNIAFCTVSLGVLWLGLARHKIWAFWTLLAGFSIALLAGIAADSAVGYAAPQVNAISAGILGLGFVLVAAAVFRNP